MNILGNRIKKERENLGLTREELAKKIGVSYSAVSMYEQGNREPSNDLMLQLCEIFDCSVDYLIGKNNCKELFDLRQNLVDKIFSINNISKDVLDVAITNYINGVNFDYDDMSDLSLLTGKIYESSWTYEAYLVANKFDCDINDLELKTDEDNENYKKIEIKVQQDMIKELNYIKNNYTAFYYPKTIKIPVLGIVKAGYDYLANENIIDYVSITDSNLNNKDFFALKVKGNSMIPEIYENDIAIVRKQSDFDNGDYVVALINGEEATIKTAYKTETGLLLKPANNSVAPLIFDKNDIEKLPVKIIGVVYNITRSFK